MNGLSSSFAVGAGEEPDRIPALVEVVEAAGPSGSVVRIQTHTGTRLAWCWVALNRHDTVRRGHASILPFRRSIPQEVLVGFEPDDRIPIRDLVHDGLCPIPDVVAHTVALVESIDHPGIRECVTSALLDSRASPRFWRCPASLAHHHAIEGGLALHSLEVATLVASSRGLSTWDRDLGIAYALLHDYGKVLCYGNGRYTKHQKRGHVAVGLELLELHVQNVGWNDPEAETQLMELLGGPQQGPYPLALGRIVRAFDQKSCEADHLRREARISADETART
jgi:hypothetical protein